MATVKLTDKPLTSEPLQDDKPVVIQDGKVMLIQLEDVQMSGPPGKDGTPGKDGAKGDPGEDGFSPTVMIEKSGKTTTITITDKDGRHVATILDGADGTGGGGENPTGASIYIEDAELENVDFSKYKAGDIVLIVEDVEVSRE